MPVSEKLKCAFTSCVGGDAALKLRMKVSRRGRTSQILCLVSQEKISQGTSTHPGYYAPAPNLSEMLSEIADGHLTSLDSKASHLALYSTTIRPHGT